MAYKSGKEWNGNKNGRPVGTKTTDIRNVLAKELAQQIHGDTKEIIQILIAHAKQEKEWAIKLYVNGILPYCLGKPKAEVDDEGVDNSEMVIRLAESVPAELIDKMKQMLVENGNGREVDDRS